MNRLRMSLVLGITLSALTALAVSIATYQQGSFGASIAFRAFTIFLVTLSAIFALSTLSRFAPGSPWMKLSLAFTFAAVVFLLVVLVVAVFRIRLAG
jgi:hypothetical protein